MPAPFRALALAALLSAVPAAAQEPLPVTLDLSFGMGAGAGGSTVGGEGVVLDATLGAPLARTGGGTVLGALSAGVYGPVATDLICAVDDSGGCRPLFPVLLGAGVLAGVQRGGAGGAAVRVLAGPSVFRSDEDVTAMALQGRFDVDTPPFLHSSVVLSVRGLVLPSYRGETLRFVGVGVGLRVR